MTRTRDTPMIPPVTRNAAANSAQNGKRPRGTDSINVNIVDIGQPAPGKKAKTTVSKSKFQQNIDNPPTVESEVVTTEISRTGRDLIVPEPQVPARRSARAQTTALPVPPKRKRRTKAEIAADNAKAEEEKKQKEVLIQENHRMLMQMDIAEDIDRQETVAQTIRTFADLEDDGGEEFIGYEEAEGSESELNGDAEDELMLKETNKALQKELKALKERLDGGKKKGKGGKKTSQKEQKAAVASGLLPDWNVEAEAIKELAKKQARVQILAGGLEDSDAEAVNPFPSTWNPGPRTLTDKELTEGAKKAKRDFSRRNELVSIVVNTEEDKYVPQRKTMVKIPRSVGDKVEKHKEEPVKSQKPKKDLMRINAPKPKSDSAPVQTAVAVKIKSKRLNGNNVRMSDLPAFAQEKWRDTFLPTLYDKFFASNQPFNTFNIGSDQFVNLLQVVIDKVYPDVEYQVTSLDSIHFLAYNRVNKKRSNIGSGAIKLIKGHLDTLAGELASKNWLRWSLRVDGPLFFKDPSPMGSSVDHNDKAYQYPGGRLLSPFIISLGAPLLCLTVGSASDNGYPKGLAALIMAALKRAARHLSKPSVKVKDFSKEFWGSQVKTYYDGFHGRNGITETRWKELVAACLGNSEDSEADTQDADLSILDNDRAHIFNFCSPVKPPSRT